MDSTQYSLYIDDIISLSTYMVLKSSASANAVNKALEDLYSANQNSIYLVNDGDPESWKYYMNLSGQYHASDTMMTVISQDTLETINFTVANLAIHTATAAAYAPGTRYYLDLVSRYPTQSQLIRGIVNPVDITTAINADDGTILWYDSTLTESNEMNLMTDLQRLIYQFYRRWYVYGYSIIEDLYDASFQASLYAKLPVWIEVIRLSYCKTYQAHSYHVKAYLTSKAPLDDYVDSMTLFQRMYFYRNIDYILRNAGKQSTFEDLIQNVMTVRGLPISTWNLAHDETNLVNTYLPSPIFVREDLNMDTSDGGAETRTVEEMLNAEASLATGNATFESDGRLQETIDATTYTVGSEYKTKIMESTVLDTTDASAFTLTDALFNHWLYWASTGRYSAATTVTNPVTGDVYNLTAKDAVLVYIYAYAMYQGMTPTTIPPVTATFVVRTPQPTYEEVESTIQMQYLNENDLSIMLDAMPTIDRSYISITGFNAAVRDIHAAQLFQHNLYSAQGNLWTRAYLSQAMHMCYADIPCDYGAGTSYADWLSSQSIDLSGLSSDQYLAIANSIVTDMTGASLTTTESVSDIQKAMLGIMRALSSYSIQYIANVNSSPVIEIDWPAVRIGDIDVAAEGEIDLYGGYGTILSVDGKGASLIDKLIIPDVSTYNWQAHGSAEFDYECTVDMMQVTRMDIAKTVPLVRARAYLADDPDQTPSGLPSVVSTISVKLDNTQPLGLQALPEAFETMDAESLFTISESDNATLLARYVAHNAAQGIPGLSLSDVITQRTLSGLTPPSAS